MDENERPLYPTKILSVDVLNSPFDDIEPRITPSERRVLAEQERVKREKAEKEARLPKGKKRVLIYLFALFL